MQRARLFNIAVGLKQVKLCAPRAVNLNLWNPKPLKAKTPETLRSSNPKWALGLGLRVLELGLTP